MQGLSRSADEVIEDVQVPLVDKSAEEPPPADETVGLDAAQGGTAAEDAPPADNDAAPEEAAAAQGAAATEDAVPAQDDVAPEDNDVVPEVAAGSQGAAATEDAAPEEASVEGAAPAEAAVEDETFYPILKSGAGSNAAPAEEGQPDNAGREFNEPGVEEDGVEGGLEELVPAVLSGEGADQADSVALTSDEAAQEVATSSPQAPEEERVDAFHAQDETGDDPEPGNKPALLTENPRTLPPLQFDAADPGEGEMSTAVAAEEEEADEAGWAAPALSGRSLQQNLDHQVDEALAKNAASLELSRTKAAMGCENR
jgi:hypothetical protein